MTRFVLLSGRVPCKTCKTKTDIVLDQPMELRGTHECPSCVLGVPREDLAMFWRAKGERRVANYAKKRSIICFPVKDGSQTIPGYIVRKDAVDDIRKFAQQGTPDEDSTRSTDPDASLDDDDVDLDMFV